MERSTIIITSICTGVIAFIISCYFSGRESRKENRRWLMMNECKRLIGEVVKTDTVIEQLKSLSKVQMEALQKIKAICGHLGVQVEIDPYTKGFSITPSIDLIKSLSFMKEYLPEIEEQWWIYKEHDAQEYLNKLREKEEWMLEEMKKVETEDWNRLDDIKRHLMIKGISYKYDTLRNQKGESGCTNHSEKQ